MAFLFVPPNCANTVVGIHPRVLCLFDNCPMAAPGVFVQLRHRLDDLCPNGIKMDIADEGKEIIVFVAEYGFVPILEEMSLPAVPAVEVLGVPGKKFSHDG